MHGMQLLTLILEVHLTLVSGHAGAWFSHGGPDCALSFALIALIR